MQTVCGKILGWILTGIAAFALVACVICLCGADFYGIDFPGRLYTLAFLLGIGAILYYGRKIALPSKRNLFIIGFSVANLTMAFFLLSYNTRPVSDYSAVFAMAEDMYAGNFNIHDYGVNSYPYLFSWQTGIAWFESLVFHIVGRPSLTALKLVNLLCINATLYLTYRVGRSFCDERCGARAFLALCVFYPLLVTVGQFSNQNAVTPLLLVFFLLIRREKYTFAGLLVPFINLLRPIGIVAVVAVTVLLLYRSLGGRGELMKSVRRLICFLIPYFLLTTAINATFENWNYTDGPLTDSHIPYFKFKQGLDIDTWQSPFEKLEEAGNDLAVYNEADLAIVREAYLDHPFSTLAAHLRKMTMVLGSFDWKGAYTYGLVVPEFTSVRFTLATAFGWAEYIVLVTVALAGVWNWRRSGRKPGILAFFFICFTAAYFFVEAWPSYRYELYPLMAVFAGSFRLRVNLLE